MTDTPTSVQLAEVLDLLEKRAQIEAPNAAAALRWTAKLAVQKWGNDEWWCHWRDGAVACTATGPFDGYCADHHAMWARWTCTCPDSEIAHRLDCPAGAR